MGIMRKMTSVSTMGLVDYRSDKERTAKYTKQTRNAARAQAAQQMQSMELQRKANDALNHANVREEVRTTTYVEQPQPTGALSRMAAKLEQKGLEMQAKKNGEPMPVAVEQTHVVEVVEQPAAQLPPAGWYADPDGSGQQRWFDGAAWTDFMQPSA